MNPIFRGLFILAFTPLVLADYTMCRTFEHQTFDPDYGVLIVMRVECQLIEDDGIDIPDDEPDPGPDPQDPVDCPQKLALKKHYFNMRETASTPVNQQVSDPTTGKWGNWFGASHYLDSEDIGKDETPYMGASWMASPTTIGNKDLETNNSVFFNVKTQAADSNAPWEYKVLMKLKCSDGRETSDEQDFFVSDMKSAEPKWEIEHQRTTTDYEVIQGYHYDCLSHEYTVSESDSFSVSSTTSTGLPEYLSSSITIQGQETLQVGQKLITPAGQAGWIMASVLRHSYKAEEKIWNWQGTFKRTDRFGYITKRTIDLNWKQDLSRNCGVTE